jgi:NAD(P)-dependent dehydrogenase (short-subunit alcohol dehydrogenase family)
MGLLDGRRALVTGGAHGIGRATCRRLRAEGAHVAVLDLDGGEAEAAAREVEGAAFQVDVRDPERVEAVTREAAAALGGLDLVVNNAGAGHLASLDRHRDPDFERLIGANLAGTFHVMRAALPRLREAGGGAVVNNASLSGLRPTAGESIYAAAKAGVIALTQAAANEYGPEVRVNCVSPGIIHTRLSEGLFRMEGALEPVLAATPLRRAGTAEEVADVIVFLASDEARFVTGQNLVVDGGLGLPQAGIDALLKSLLARIEGT